MRWAVSVLCTVAASAGLVRKQSMTLEGPAPGPAPGPGGRFDEAGYAADWHKEWQHGDFPRYTETYENKEAVSQYVERQSDGVQSPAYGEGFLQQQGPAPGPAPGPGGRFDEAGYAADWHKEWQHGDFPRYTETYENKEAVSQYVDRQSDGVQSPAYGESFLEQRGPAPGPAPGPGGRF